MLTLSSSSVRKFRALKGIAIMFAAWVLGTAACAAAREENVTVRQIGPLDSVIADRILGQVNALPFPLPQASPILLQGKTLSSLGPEHEQELQATYQAGHTIVLLDATLAHIRTLHGIIGEGVHYPGFSDTGLQRAFMDIPGRCPVKALHTQEVMDIHIQPCRGGRACPPASRYVNASSSALASCKSAVSNPSVNQP
jgi:hypothetical protein